MCTCQHSVPKLILINASQGVIQDFSLGGEATRAAKKHGSLQGSEDVAPQPPRKFLTSSEVNFKAMPTLTTSYI